MIRTRRPALGSGHVKLLARHTQTGSLAHLSDAAFRMCINAAAQSIEWRNPGFLEERLAFAVPRAPVTKKARARAIAELEREGIWVRVEGGWKLDAKKDPRGHRVITLVIAQEPWDNSAKSEVFERDGHACRYCGSSSDLSLDHLVPRKQGGTDHAANLVVACKRCNSRKGGRTPEQARMVLRPIQTETDTGDSDGPISSSGSNDWSDA